MIRRIFAKSIIQPLELGSLIFQEFAFQIKNQLGALVEPFGELTHRPDRKPSL